MAIGVDSLVEVTLNQLLSGSVALNVFQYEVSGSIPVGGAVAIAEGWWNHVKTTTRALVVAGYGNVFRSVKIRELNNPTGDFAEFDIPTGEQAGTRSNPTQLEAVPPMMAAGARLTVGTRLTRSGQKRFGYLTENDSNGSALQSSYITLFAAWLNVITANMTLGAPAALTILDPIVCKKDALGNVVAHQEVVGYVINPYVTTQNSRKIGRGI